MKQNDDDGLVLGCGEQWGAEKIRAKMAFVSIVGWALN